MSQLQALKQDIIKMKGQFANALPKSIPAERFERLALTALSKDKKLQQCSADSVIGSLMLAGQLGLEPNTPLGHAYLVPYKTTCQFILGYRGLLELAYRTGLYKSIIAMEVYKNDTFDYGYGLDPFLTHKPARRTLGEKPIAYYAAYQLKDGGRDFRVMYREEVEEFAKAKSKTFNNGPWQTDFDAMAKKTLLRRVLDYAPKTVEFSYNMTSDEMPVAYHNNQIVEIEESNESGNPPKPAKSPKEQILDLPG